MTPFASIVASFILVPGALAQPTPDPGPAPCTIEWPEDPGRDAFSPNTWPQGIMPFEFDAGVDASQRAIVRGAMDEIMEIRDSNRNSSAVGRRGGPQSVRVVSWNFPYIVVHELLHALGSNHEQARPDRDKYVLINHENIEPGREHNFEIRESANPAGAYDFESVMHYGDFAFSVNGLPTITARPPFKNFQNTMGQRSRLSEGDAVGLVAAYGTPPVSDLTGDNFVTNSDLGVLLGAWGTDGVDLDGDGTTDSSDLGIMLAEWGP